MSSVYALACISGSTSQLYLKLSSGNLEASSQSILLIRNSSKAPSDTPRLLQACCPSSQCPSKHTLHLLQPAWTSIGSLAHPQQLSATPSAQKELVLH